MVVGGGAAGTLVATRLLDESVRRQVAMRVIVVEPRPALGQGVAFSATDRRHVLNVPALRMTAYPEDGEHFLRWLARNDRDVGAADFVPRAWFGQYLGDVIAAAARRATLADLRVVRARAIGVERIGTRCRVLLDTGEALPPADGVVLALGHLGVETGWAPEALRESSRFIADPWTAGALDGVPDDADVMFVGSGLTMVDAAMQLDRPGRTLRVVSRNGLLPHRHQRELLPAMEAPQFSCDAPQLAELRRVMTAHIGKAQRRYGDWRPAIDSIRALTPKLWSGLDADDRADFVRTDARAWDSVRHRIPPDSADVVHEARLAGRLVLTPGEVVDAVDSDSGIVVELSDGSSVTVGAVINCTGPCDRPERSRDPFVRSLLEAGLVRSGSLGVGFDSRPDGRVVGVSDDDSLPLFTLAALRKGSLWESVAMPEIRVQAAELARCLVGEERTDAVRPTDQYGLPVSTNAEAADLWRQALDQIRRVQAGAPALIAAAVEVDPGFALGHAALALLARECEADVDAAASLAAALDAIRLRANTREISFVRMVEARLVEDAAAGDQQLLRHIKEHPIDCLAVSVALPTIAFSGVAQPLEDSWALVDALAPEYGDDWWFRSLIAFTRQEQDRFAEAADLAELALALEPAAGHAVHARAHVTYETGDHAAGLGWLDGWIAEHGGDTNHRAHFVWHAALHEIAMGDFDAALRRYHEELAPPRVTGARALVDSASLLWRLRMLGASVGCADVLPALAAVDECVFDRPATTFTALHAAIGLAGAGDLAALGRLEDYAASHPNRSFAVAVVPLCRGLAAVADDRPADAVGPLTALRTMGLRRFGGSAAQQEIVEETLLHAMVASGRRAEAATLLEERHARRGSPADKRRLDSLLG
ncbi:MAG TPA: FAD/NAD(P)-binding protein [Mycobacteriales bacterium]|nr:FAD/NAD(P)-binding protein [Mycobacteriales bacterium]